MAPDVTYRGEFDGSGVRIRIGRFYFAILCGVKKQDKEDYERI